MEDSKELQPKEKVSIAAKLVFILVGLTFFTPIAFHNMGISEAITLAALGIYTAFGVSFDIMNFKHTKLQMENHDEAPK